MFPMCCALNRMMSDGACSQFVLHAWKAEVCANCLKSRLKHVDNTDAASAPLQSENCRSTSFPAKHDNMHSAHSPDIGAAKPSPAKVKPAISAKPEKPKKPTAAGDQPSVNSDIKPCDKDMSAEHLTPSKSKSTVSNNASHVPVTEEELISSSLGAPEFSRMTDVGVEDEKGTHSNAHHYELYDITARGLSRTPREFQLENRPASEVRSVSQSMQSEHAKSLSAMRAVEIAEAHVAMPYNVVDVTIPRQMSSSGIQSATVPTSTWLNKPQPTKKVTPKSPPKPQEQVTKSKEEIDHSSNVSQIVQSDLVSDRYAHRIYEAIDEVNQFCSKTTAHSSVNKSPAFEAKMAALASIDFKKTGKPAITVAPDVTPPEESLSLKSDVALHVQDTVAVPVIKPDKTRKSGGKTFLQKFLKFGSKDTSETVRSSNAIPDSNEASLKVVQCPSSPSLGKTTVSEDSKSASKTTVSEDSKSASDAAPPQAAPLNEKQAMLMNLKDCLSKRQTSVGGESIEISPVRLRTQTSEPTLSKDSTQSFGSMQQTHGSNVEKNDEKHTVIVQETSPPANSQSTVFPIPEQQPVSSDALASVALHVCKELSETDKSLDKKSNEMQRLDVTGLSVMTEDAANADSSISVCSSDTISPTPSDLSVEGSDHHSLKRKSRTDRQGKQLSASF